MAKVFLTDQAQEDVKKLPKRELAKIKKRLAVLEEEPFCGKKLTGKLHNFYSLKCWPYRIIYILVKNNEAWVVHIMHRKEVYKRI